jgi:hypothetical protein
MRDWRRADSGERGELPQRREQWTSARYRRALRPALDLSKSETPMMYSSNTCKLSSPSDEWFAETCRRDVSHNV